MKKIMLLLICCFTLFALAGCDSAVGTWKFYEKTTDIAGYVKTIKVGEKDTLGKDVTEDYMVVVFEKDGTGTLTQTYVDGSFTFTWEEVDGVIKVTGNFVNFDAKIEKGYLIFDYAGGTYKLKK